MYGSVYAVIVVSSFVFRLQHGPDSSSNRANWFPIWSGFESNPNPASAVEASRSVDKAYQVQLTLYSLPSQAEVLPHRKSHTACPHILLLPHHILPSIWYVCIASTVLPNSFPSHACDVRSIMRLSSGGSGSFPVWRRDNQ